MKQECPGFIAVLGRDRLPVAWLTALTTACNYGSCRDRYVPNIHPEKLCVIHVWEYSQRWRMINTATFIMCKMKTEGSGELGAFFISSWELFFAQYS